VDLAFKGLSRKGINIKTNLLTQFNLAGKPLGRLDHETQLSVIDHSEQRRTDLHEVAHSDQAFRNATGEWRHHARAMQVEFRDGACGFCSFDFRPRLLRLGCRAIQLTRGRDLVLLQFQDAFQIALGILRVGPGLGHGGSRLCGLRLVGGGVDQSQQLPGLDPRAKIDQRLLHLAFHLRPHSGFVLGQQGSNHRQCAIHQHAVHRSQRHGNARRTGVLLGRGGRLAAASHKQQPGAQNQ